MALPENQEYITKAWLMSDRKNVVFNTDLGQKIKRDTDTVYVSTDNARTWTALHEFVAKVSTLHALIPYCIVSDSYHLIARPTV